MSSESFDGEREPSVTKALNSAIATGCRMLSIREHSESQLFIKLQRKKFDKDIIDQGIAYLKQEGWLSDTRFCNSFIRSKAEKGQGLKRIISELQQHNVELYVIEQQLLEENIDWQENCFKALKKKLLIANQLALDDTTKDKLREKFSNIKKRVKIENFLRFRGFSSSEINQAITRLEKRFLN